VSPGGAGRGEGGSGAPASARRAATASFSVMHADAIGAHCQHALCKQRDFLPVKCTRCNKLYCYMHCKPELHECCTTTVEQVVQVSEHKTFNCALKGCIKYELVPITCTKCRLLFCLNHRHADDHKCTGRQPTITVQNNKNTSGKDILAAAKKKVGSSNNDSKGKPTRQNEQYLKVAQLKFKAVVKIYFIFIF
jgi:hypothetical protein